MVFRGAHKAGVIASLPAAHASLGRRHFEAGGEKVPYFVHPYNATWRGERCVEIPLAQRFVARYPRGTGVEVGNVLRHYGAVEHRVVDKYEVASGVENIDVLAMTSAAPFEFAVSISTFEHVGLDEDGDETKALRAIRHVQSLLAPSGALWLSFLLGHHPTLTQAVVSGDLDVRAELIYKRTPRRGWELIARSALPERPLLGDRILFVAELPAGPG